MEVHQCTTGQRRWYNAAETEWRSSGFFVVVHQRRIQRMHSWHMTAKTELANERTGQNPYCLEDLSSGSVVCQLCYLIAFPIIPYAPFNVCYWHSSQVVTAEKGDYVFTYICWSVCLLTELLMKSLWNFTNWLDIIRRPID